MRFYITRNTSPEAQHPLHVIIDNAKIVFAGFGDQQEIQNAFKKQFHDSRIPEVKSFTLEDLWEMPIHTQGTPFQESVWALTKDIPNGVLWTYKHMAEKLGNPKAYRAVGTALGKNPVCYFIPCHRVVRVSNEDAGYRWGPDVKKELLKHEGSQLRI